MNFEVKERQIIDYKCMSLDADFLDEHGVIQWRY